MACDLERAGSLLAPACLKVLLAVAGVLGDRLTLARAGPRAVARAAGQVVVRGGVPELGAGLVTADADATPSWRGGAERGRLAQRQAALLLLGVQRGGGRRQAQGVHLQGLGAAAGGLHGDALHAAHDLLPLWGSQNGEPCGMLVHAEGFVHLWVFSFFLF